MSPDRVELELGHIVQIGYLAFASRVMTNDS